MIKWLYTKMNRNNIVNFSNTINISYDTKEEIFFKDFVRPFYSISNFAIENDRDSLFSKIFISGNSFIFDFSQTQYYHLIQDTIGQFLAIKRYMPDIKIIFMQHSKMTRISTDKILEDLKKILKIEESDIIYINNYKEIVFESITFFHTLFNPFLMAIDDIKIIDKVDDPDFKFQIIAAEELRKNVLPHINHNRSNKKIYISRYVGELTLFEDLRNSINNNDEKMIEIYKERIEERTFKDRCDILKLEDFFFNNGFEIVNLERMGIIEQAEFFYNAKTIATFNGTSGYNCIFANESSEIILMNIHNNYSWIHKELFSSLGISFYESPPQNDSHTKIDYKEIIDYIEKCVLL